MDILFFPFSKRLKYLTFKCIKYALILFFSTSILAVIIYKFVPVYYTPLMAIRTVQQSFKGKETKCKNTWKQYGLISKSLKQAAVTAEDCNFCDHNGFDWNAISTAITNNISGKPKIGGSTISQQTAKNVFLWPGRSWLRKGLEAYFTFLIELVWSKERILEVYLNIVEIGDGIYGVESAAQTYYGIHAIDINGKQAASIITQLPSPLKRDIKKPTKEVILKQKQIEKGLKHAKIP